jgi:hypothetical protein
MRVTVSRSTRAGKKWMAALENGPTVHFGAQWYEDFTQHGDDARKASYLARHRANENWTLEGVRSAGFWARYLLWNKRTLGASATDIRRRFPSLSVSLKA